MFGNTIEQAMHVMKITPANQASFVGHGGQLVARQPLRLRPQHGGTAWAAGGLLAFLLVSPLAAQVSLLDPELSLLPGREGSVAAEPLLPPARPAVNALAPGVAEEVEAKIQSSSDHSQRWSGELFGSLLEPSAGSASGWLRQPPATGEHESCPDVSGERQVPYQPEDFRCTPLPLETYQPELDRQTYFGKYTAPVQRPWVEWWRPFYSGGLYAPAIPVFSDVNPLTPHFLVYGDYRAAVGIHRKAGQPVRSIANRLNLEMDLRFTGTERLHAFMGPLDHNNRFTRFDFSDSADARFEEELDAQLDTVFFEGDLGAMSGGVIGVDAPFDLPFTMGRIPLLYQNGIWMEDAIDGVAIAFPWRHQPTLNWSNYEVSFFAGFNQVTSPAFNNNNQAAQVFGSAWFIEAYDGYLEADYAYLNDHDQQGRSYHNSAIAYTRRYGERISNSLRLLGNIGQAGPRVDRSADGALLLWENSWVSSQPATVVPYWNAFLGYGRPQSVARAAGSGGILRNTGINFESDALTNYPTLDESGSNAYGGAVGINLLSSDFRRQWVAEFAALDTYGDERLSLAPGAQYGLGTRWQRSLSNWTLVRADLMYGWLDQTADIYGTRVEFRWKF
jgi:hypothetical protein